MGTDIHAYPEYKLGDVGWASLCGEFELARDYELFGKMAGVRDRVAMVSPRGLPADFGDAVRDDCFEDVEPYLEAPEFRLTRERAEQCVKAGKSFWLNEHQGAISSPDWHSFTWLFLSEYRAILGAERVSTWPIGVTYYGLLAMLEEIERRGCRTRVVMWFDN